MYGYVLNQKTIWAEHWVNPGLSCHLWFVIAFTISLPSSDTMWQKGKVNPLAILSMSYFTFEICVREKKGTSGIFRSNFRKVHNRINFNQDEMLKTPVWYLSCAASLCYVCEAWSRINISMLARVIFTLSWILVMRFIFYVLSK